MNIKRKTAALVHLVKSARLSGQFIQRELDSRGISNVPSKEVTRLMVKYFFKKRLSSAGVIGKAVSRFVYRIVLIVVMAVTAAVAAEFLAIRKFSDSILSGKLEGVLDHFLFWIGLKSIELTGPEMMAAISLQVTIIPDMIVAMIVGAFAGFVVLNLMIWLVKKGIFSSRLKRDAAKVILEYYG